MYRVIAYHGKGNDSEVENDLHLLWDNLRSFAASRKVSHIYCFEALNDKKSADVFIVLQYEDSVGADLRVRPQTMGRHASRPLHATQIDYWFYVREGKKRSK